MPGYKVILRKDHSGNYEAPLWEPGCPLLVDAIQVSRHSETGDAFAQIKLVNISDEVVKSYKLQVQVKYEDHDPEDLKFVDLDADIPPSQNHVASAQLAHGDAEDVTIRVISAKSGFEKWGSSSDPAPIPEPRSLELETNETIERAKCLWHGMSTQFSSCANKGVRVGDGFWICPCGAVNVGKGSCHTCNAKFSDLTNANLESPKHLQASAADRAKRAQIKAEEQVQDKARRNARRKRFAKIGGGVAVVIIVAIALLSFVPSKDPALDSQQSNQSGALSSQRSSQYGLPGQLEDSNLIGKWVIQSTGDMQIDELMELGTFSALEFKENNEAALIVHLRGTALERTGTYEIRNNHVVINVPEMEAQSNGPLSISGKAIVNGQISVEGDILTTYALATDHAKTVAKKVTDEEYQDYIDQAAAKGPKSIGVGETISTDLVTLTLDSFEYQQEIYPPDTSGYYSYYADEASSTYLLAKFTYTNNGTDYSVPGQAWNASFNVDGNSYSGTILFAADSTMGSSYSVEAKETRAIYVYASIPDAVAGAGTATLTLDIPTEQNLMQTYYRSSFSHDSFTVTL